MPSGGEEEFREHVLRVNVDELTVAAAEKHIFKEGWELNSSVLRRYVTELVTWCISPSVPIDIVIPILNVSFEVDRFSIGDSVIVERLTDGLQLARWPGNPRAKAYGDVLPMATHALVLEGWSLGNPNALGWLWSPDDGEPIEIPVLDRFFQALVVFVSAPTGYVQVLYRPRGWSHGSIGSLPDLVQGPLLPHFSSAMQPAQEPATLLSLEQVKRLRDGFLSLNGQYHAVSIAAHRLSEAERRNNDVDRVLDLCIGIESLVAGSAGDATYKVKVRIAAVLADIGIKNTADIMVAAKAVYSLRSAVAHGRGKPDRFSNVILEGRQVETVEAARYFLRKLLWARLNRPNLTVDDIDTRILAGALEQWAIAKTSLNAEWSEDMRK